MLPPNLMLSFFYSKAFNGSLILGWNTNFWKAGKALGPPCLHSSTQAYPPTPLVSSFAFEAPPIMLELNSLTAHVLSSWDSLTLHVGQANSFSLMPGQKLPPLWCLTWHLQAEPDVSSLLLLLFVHISLYWLSYCTVDPWTPRGFWVPTPHPTLHSRKSTDNFWFPQNVKKKKKVAYCWPDTLPIRYSWLMHILYVLHIYIYYCIVIV